MSDKAMIRAQRRELKLKEEAKQERLQKRALRSELKEVRAELEETDWLGVAFNVGSGLAGNAASGASRAMGWTDKATHWEPIAAVVVGFAAARSDMPNGVVFAQGLAARWVSERVEKSVREVRNAVKSKADDADDSATPESANAQPKEVKQAA